MPDPDLELGQLYAESSKPSSSKAKSSSGLTFLNEGLESPATQSEMPGIPFISPEALSLSPPSTGSAGFKSPSPKWSQRVWSQHVDHRFDCMDQNISIAK